MLIQIDVRQLKQKLDAGESPVVLDVREPIEVNHAPFPGAVHIPMNDIPSRLRELDPEQETVVLCHHGMRSAQVAMYLLDRGFEKVVNLMGGIDAWSLVVDPSVRRY